MTVGSGDFGDQEAAQVASELGAQDIRGDSGQFKRTVNGVRSLWGKVRGAKPDAWYDANAVSGKFVDELVNELGIHGFKFSNSGHFARTVNGIYFRGVRGTYTRQAGRFSWDEATVYGGGNQPGLSGLVVYYGVSANVGSRRFYGFPEPRIGISHPKIEWQHIGVTTSMYGPDDKMPSSQYVPNVTAKEALAKVGLEAKVN